MPPSKPYLVKEKLFVGAYSFFLAAILMHFTGLSYHGCCGEGISFDTSQWTAPSAYRVAIPYLLSLVYRVHRLPGPVLVGGAVFVFTLLAFWLLYQVMVDESHGISTQARALRMALFLCFSLFPAFFVVPWGTTETLPTACYLGLALICLAPTRKGWLWTLLLLLATFLQSFARSDVPFIFGIAVFLSALPIGPLKAVGNRPSNLWRGLAVSAIAAGTQLYLQFVKFPHRPYLTGSPIMFGYNLSPRIFWVPLLAILPFVLAGYVMAKQRLRLTPTETLIVLASALYIPLWFTVGIVLEVRIFVPFLLALCIVAARAVASFLSDAQPERA